jgi:membrane-bound lytic murein transglycosylase D
MFLPSCQRDITPPSSHQQKFNSAHTHQRLKQQNALADPEGKIPHTFKSEIAFQSHIHFWFSIYTFYTSSQYLFHDKDDLSLVYAVVDFSELEGQLLNASLLERLQKKMLITKQQQLISSLGQLQKDIPTLISLELKQLFDKIILRCPQCQNDLSKRTKYIAKLKENLRSQKGQKNLIEKGLYTFSSYESWMLRKTNLFDLPKELLAIPFLESSFNPKAHSKVGASGVWQIMPAIAKHYFPRSSPLIDYRRNIYFSTLASLHLIKDNFKILKRWDLTVAAYNSGPKHFLIARRMINKSDLSLADVLENYQHPHLGFAAKNFYAEFIALVYVLAYRQQFFSTTTILRRTHPLIYKTKVSITKFQFSKFISQNKEIFFDLNNHIPTTIPSIPSGTLVLSDEVLPSKFFKLIPDNGLLLRPRLW